eukprot:COSAG05_NODE_7058_length_861_cov_1.816273_1_plen_46_part_10
MEKFQNAKLDMVNPSHINILHSGMIPETYTNNFLQKHYSTGGGGGG